MSDLKTWVQNVEGQMSFTVRCRWRKKSSGLFAKAKQSTKKVRKIWRKSWWCWFIFTTQRQSIGNLMQYMVTFGGKLLFTEKKFHIPMLNYWSSKCPTVDTLGDQHTISLNYSWHGNAFRGQIWIFSTCTSLIDADDLASSNITNVYEYILRKILHETSYS